VTCVVETRVVCCEHLSDVLRTLDNCDVDTRATCVVETRVVCCEHLSGVLRTLDWCVVDTRATCCGHSSGVLWTVVFTGNEAVDISAGAHP